MSNKNQEKTIAQRIIETVQKVNTEEGVTRLELHNEVERLLGEEYIKGYNDGLKAGEESGKMFCRLCDLFLS